MEGGGDLGLVLLALELGGRHLLVPLRGVLRVVEPRGWHPPRRHLLLLRVGPCTHHQPRTITVALLRMPPATTALACKAHCP